MNTISIVNVSNVQPPQVVEVQVGLLLKMSNVFFLGWYYGGKKIAVTIAYVYYVLKFVYTDTYCPPPPPRMNGTSQCKEQPTF